VENLIFRVTRSFGADEHGRIILDGVVEQGEPEPGQLVAVELINGDVKMTHIDAVELHAHRDGSVGVKLTLPDGGPVPPGVLVRGR
jgi:hypothetical protein